MKGNSTVGEVIFSFPTDLSLHFNGKRGRVCVCVSADFGSQSNGDSWSPSVSTWSGVWPSPPTSDMAVATWPRTGEAPSSFLEYWGPVITSLLSQALVTSITLRPEILGGNQLVIIVGVICATILLLPVLILVVKRTYGDKRYRAAPISWAGGLEVPLAWSGREW